MKSRVEMLRSGSASIEVCTISHEDHEYTAAGSLIDETRGLLVGYIKGRDLVTWGGDHICSLRVTGRFTTLGRKTTSYRTMYNGQHYHGRCSDENMLLRLRRNRRV